MISKDVLAKIDEYRAAFIAAKPFKHVIIDNFLEADGAERMLQDFPSFDRKKAINEIGEVGGKAVYEKIVDISPFYRRFSDYVKSEPFLESISRLTDIRDLQNDDLMFGGGTHENLHDQELAPHVDFNYDPNTGLHRRLNLLIYLNKEWEEGWGGSIELHSDPRNPEDNRVISILPIFNRCVLFETNEYSWHGFPKIKLPEEKRHLSRKSFSLYLYTKERPAEEIAPSHATFYVQRPLPQHIKPGRTLSEDDFSELQSAIRKRDKMIEYYQNKELEFGKIQKELLDHISSTASLVRLPMTGYGLQQGPVRGFWPDGWASRHLSLEVRAEKDISRVQVFGYLPKYFSEGNEITVRADSSLKTFRLPGDDCFKISLPVEYKAGSVVSLTITSAQTVSGQQAGVNGDTRECAFLLTQIRMD